jgi:plastocyanin
MAELDPSMRYPIEKETLNMFVHQGAQPKWTSLPNRLTVLAPLFLSSILLSGCGPGSAAMDPAGRDSMSAHAITSTEPASGPSMSSPHATTGAEMRTEGRDKEMGSTPKSDPYQITIDNFVFAPAELTVPAGTTVTWVNRDDVPHTATSTSKPRVFDSRALDTDQKFSYVFGTPGTYEYFCAVHPRMTGTIVVK